MKSILNNILKYSFAIWISFLISIISLPFITRLLEPELYGQYTLIISLSMFLMNLLLMGGDQAIHRYYEKFSLSIFKNFFVTIFILLLPMLALTIISLNALNFTNISLSMLLILILLSSGLALLRVAEQVFRIINSFKRYTFQIIFYAFLSKILILPLLYFTKDFNLFLIFLASVTFIYGLFSFIMLDSKILGNQRSSLSLSNFKQILSFSFPLMVSAQLYLLKDLIPRFLLYLKDDLFSLGMFSAAYSLVSLLGVFQAGFIAFYGPYFYKNYKINKEYINNIHHIFTALMILIASVLIVFSNELVYLIGPDFKNAEYHFVILVISPVLIAISETFVYCINVTNNTRVHLNISIISLVVSLFTFITFYQLYGGFAASLSILFSSIVFLLLRYYYANKFLPMFSDFIKTLFSIFLLIVFSLSIFTFKISDISDKMILLIFLLIALFINYHKMFSKMLKLKNIK